MLEYQQRVVDEKEDLDIKRDKLEEFLGTTFYANLPSYDQTNLTLQLYVMGLYSTILDSRIKNFK